MNQNVLITITGKQSYGRDKDKIEVTTVGTLEEQDDKYILHYTEEQEAPNVSVPTTLTVTKDEKRVELMRSGKNGSLLIIERSKRNLCTYGTDFGDMLLGIFGKNIEAEYNGDGGVFSFSYDIDINGALSSQNDVEVKFRSNYV